MAINESEKLQYQEFQKIVDQVPLQTFYQVKQSDSYNPNGYSFYLKSPNENALLDPDIWVRYNFTITEGANNAISNIYNNTGGGNNATGVPAQSDIRLAMRQGNIMGRITQNINVQVNNYSMTCESWKIMDVLSRLYISDDQSRHEFSASGGAFDSGNCGFRTISDVQTLGISTAAINNQTLGARITQGYHSVSANNFSGGTPGGNVQLYTFAEVPNSDWFYNPGFSDRANHLGDLIRRQQLPNANVNIQYGADAALNVYNFTVWERLPHPFFKMFSNDQHHGVIPNIKDLTITGQFCTSLLENMFMSNYDSVNGAYINFDVEIPTDTENCQIYLKWYTPPPEIKIPREIHMPLRRIDVWAKSYGNKDVMAANINSNNIVQISEYNISLQAIPDLLIIFVRPQVGAYELGFPCDMMMELTNLQINIEGASGKLNQITTIDLYNKWKRALKYKKEKIMTYEQFQRYCCIAALIPEDYGCIKGPGYENYVTLGVQCTAVDWWNNPSMGLQIPERIFAHNIGGAVLPLELVVIAIYDKYDIKINADGSASSELTRISSSLAPAASSIGLAELRPTERIGLQGIL